MSANVINRKVARIVNTRDQQSQRFATNMEAFFNPNSTVQSIIRNEVPTLASSFRGPWNADTSYAKGDVVLYNGSCYLATATTTTAVPTTESDWNVLVQRGEDGTLLTSFRGPWDARVVYAPADIVTHRGSCYVADREIADGTEPSAEPWRLVAAKGSLVDQYQGAWSATNIYARGDVVTLNGSCYLATQTNYNVSPATFRTQWAILASAADANAASLDTTPTSGSTRGVTSGGVFSWVTQQLVSKQNVLSFDEQPTANSVRMLTSGVIQAALATKQNTLNIDTTLTSQGSGNPISSNGVYQALGDRSRLIYETVADTSTNIATTGWVSAGLATKVNTAAVVSTPANGSTAPISAGGVYEALGSRVKLEYESSVLNLTDASNTKLIPANVLNAALGGRMKLEYESDLANLSSTNTNLVTGKLLKAGLDGKQNTLSIATEVQSGVTNPITANGVYVALGNRPKLEYESDATSIANANNNNIITSNMLNTVLTNRSTSTVMANSALLMTSGGLSTVLASYAPLNNPSFTGTQSVSCVAEQIYVASSLLTNFTSISLDFTTIKSIVFCPVTTTSSTLSLAITNFPAFSSASVYNLTLILPSKTYVSKSTLTINGISRAMIVANGTIDVSTATYVLQQINILYITSTSMIVTTNVVSCY